jgi:hypothetical protein
LFLVFCLYFFLFCFFNIFLDFFSSLLCFVAFVQAFHGHHCFFGSFSFKGFMKKVQHISYRRLLQKKNLIKVFSFKKSWAIWLKPSFPLILCIRLYDSHSFVKQHSNIREKNQRVASSSLLYFLHFRFNFFSLNKVFTSSSGHLRDNDFDPHS